MNLPWRSFKLTRDQALLGLGMGVVSWGAFMLRPDIVYSGIAIWGAIPVLRGQDKNKRNGD